MFGWVMGSEGQKMIPLKNNQHGSERLAARGKEVCPEISEEAILMSEKYYGSQKKMSSKLE